MVGLLQGIMSYQKTEKNVDKNRSLGWLIFMWFVVCAFGESVRLTVQNDINRKTRKTHLQMHMK